MDPTHERLLKLVREARREHGLTKQKDFIDATGLGRTTIQRFERGERLSETAYRSIDWAIHWTAGSCVAVLDGGDPTSQDEGAPTAAAAPVSGAPLPPLAERLPTRARRELENGEIVDINVYDLTVGAGARMITILLRDPQDPAQPKDFVQMRQETRAYDRAIRRLNGWPELPHEPDDPPEDATSGA